MEKIVFEPGQTLLDRFEIKKKLGEGYSSTVYEAFDRKLEREVALKVISSLKTIEERVRREIKTAANLTHPNLVTLYDLIETTDYFVFVMELVKGINLREALRRKGKIPWPKALYIAYQIAEALEEAHKLEIVHRDVKPENIMISRDGRVKLTDFGISILIERGNREHKASGTLGYMSPEQITGRYVDETTDIFALGIVLYEMLTGKNPFASDTLKETALRVLNFNPPPPGKIQPSVPEKLDRVVLRAIGKDPEFRFQSVHQFRESLKEVQKDFIQPREDFDQQLQIVRVNVSDLTQPTFSEKVGSSLYHARNYLRLTFFSISLFIILFGSLSIEEMYKGITAILVPMGVVVVGILYPAAALWLACASVIIPVSVNYPLLGSLLGIALFVYALIFGYGRNSYYSPLPFLAIYLSRIGLFPFVFLLAGLVFEPAAAFVSGLTAGIIGVYLKNAGIGTISPFIVEIESAHSLNLNTIEGILKPLISRPSTIFEVMLIALIPYLISLTKKGTFGKMYSSLVAVIVGTISLILGYSLLPPLFKLTGNLTEKILISISPSLVLLFIVAMFIQISEISIRQYETKTRVSNTTKNSYNSKSDERTAV